MIYYVDAGASAASHTGLTPGDAVRSWRDLKIVPGDTVLFRRGSLFRDVLLPPNGEKDALIRFGAYGDGEKPAFCGSVDLSAPRCWEEIEPDIWRCTVPLGSEACNFIFDGGLSCGVLAWERGDLGAQGRWHDTRIGMWERGGAAGPGEVLLSSRGNPGEVYRSIECAIFGSRRMVTAGAYVEFSDLAFVNSGVHGFAAENAHDIAMMRCDFSFIGGCVWNRERRIRFGNAFELWDDCHDVRMEDCRCYEVYDSCFTHQGPGEKSRVPENLTIRGNVFERYGMAAYEARDKVARNTVFSDNICLDAGVGFAMQDETPPRRSEIWPQPMGHHLFLWRMERGTDGGRIEVARNYFGPAPHGGAVYSIISDEARSQFRITNNRYSPTADRMLADDGEDKA